MTALIPMIAGSVAAAGTAGTVGATAGILGSGGALTLSGLSTGLTLASSALSLFSGFQQANAINKQSAFEARSMEMQSRQEMIQAEAETIRGKQRANDIMDNTLQVIAAQRLAFSGNGVDIHFGTPVSIEKSTRKLAQLQYGVSRDDAQMRALTRRMQAQGLLSEAHNRRLAGIASADELRMSSMINAGGKLANLYARRAERG